jgi:hypothetical protein
MLICCEEIKQSIELWTISNVRSDVIHGTLSIISGNESLTISWGDLTRQYLECRSLASAIYSQQCEAFTSSETERQVLNCNFELVDAQRVNFSQPSHEHRMVGGATLRTIRRFSVDVIIW